VSDGACERRGFRDDHPMTTLMLATRNAHKAVEIRAILGDDFRCLTLNDFPAAPHVIEDADSFAGNATKKAVALARWVSATIESRALPDFVLADDSGLEVDALGGAPGVHSARFAALNAAASSGNSPDADNNARLLRLLATLPSEKRAARFCCVLALTPVQTRSVESASPICYADEFELGTQLFEGVCEGRIDLAPRGQGGFGYDPLFIPNGFSQSFAELGEETKNQISHRAKALAALKNAFCKDRLS
jgi:XTP/dITP diphosphohydrolase